MKIATKILSALLFIGATLSFASCTKDLEGEMDTSGKTPLEAPANLSYESTMSAATVTWDAVANAEQYYYEVRNLANNLVTSKGFTKSTSLTINGLRHTSEYSLIIKAIPSGSDSKQYCPSEYAKASIETQAKLIRNYVWKCNATVYFSDAQTFKSTNAVMGLDADTGYYVVENWCGSEGFDLEFELDEANETNGGACLRMVPVPGRPGYKEQSGWQERLYHGLGGTAYDYVAWDNTVGNNGWYKTNNEKGGVAYAWCMDPNNNWTYWQVTYGDGKGDATGGSEEEEEPKGPDADASESWSATAEISLGGAPTGNYAEVSFDAKTGLYTISNWFGAEGQSIAFTRDENGHWVIDTKKSTAYATSYFEGNALGFYHGLEGMANPICWIYPSDDSSQYEGTPESGKLYTYLYDPDKNWVEYSISWPASMYTWSIPASHYSGRHDSTNETTLSYNEEKDTYTVILPQYDNANVNFKIGENGEFIPVGGALQQSDDTWWWIDYSETWVFVKVPACSVDFEGGSMTLDTWNGDDHWTDTISWKALPGIDDLVGTYAQESGAWHWTGAWTWEDYSGDVTITKVDDSTIEIAGIGDFDASIQASVNTKNSTITIEVGQPYGDYFFAAYGGADKVVAKYDADCTITFENTWSVTNAGGSLYWDNGTCVLTKK